MSDWNVFFVAFTTCTAIGAVAGTQCYLSRWKAKRRTKNLKIVYAALDAHYDAVGQILDDPAPSPNLKRLVLNFSDSLSEREIARGFIEFLKKKDLKPDNSPSEESSELAELHRTRPDLVEAFGKAIVNGLVSLILRWPETASAFEELVATVSTDERKELAAAKKVVKLGNHDDKPGSLPRNKLAAANC